MNYTAKNKGLIGVKRGRYAKKSATGYEAPVLVGTMVKAALSVTTSDLEVGGDDALQISDSSFVSGSLLTETNHNDLSTEALLYGHKYSEADGITRNVGDVAPEGGYGYVQELLKKEDTVTTRVFRAVFLPSVTAQLSAWTDEAETRQKTTVFKSKPTTFKVAATADGDWHYQQEFEVSAAQTADKALAAAEAWLDTKFGVAAAATE